MHPARAGIDEQRQSVDVGGLELGQFAEDQYIRGNGMQVGKLLQYIFPRGILSRLGFFCLGVQFQLLEEHIPQLPGRGQVETHAGIRIHTLFGGAGLLVQLHGIFLEELLIDLYSFELHILQHLHQGILHLIEYLFYILFLQRMDEDILQLQRDVCILHRILLYLLQFHIAHVAL